MSDREKLAWFLVGLFGSATFFAILISIGNVVELQ